MKETNKLSVQFGISAESDFEENTWTFEMPEKFSVWAGEFAIVDKKQFEEMKTGYVAAQATVGQEVELLNKKLEFYREQTDKIRQLVFSRNDIGEPCQPLYDAIVDKITAQEKEIERLKSLISPATVAPPVKGDDSLNDILEEIELTYKPPVIGGEKDKQYWWNRYDAIPNERGWQRFGVTDRVEALIEEMIQHFTEFKPLVSGNEKSFLDVLINNYQAQISGYYNFDKTDEERAKRNAVIEEYEDLIAIFKSKYLPTQPPVSGKEVEGVVDSYREFIIRTGLCDRKNMQYWLKTIPIKETVTDGVDEDKDNFAISFAVWVMHDQQAKAYLNSGCSAYQLLEKYKDRPYIDNDSSKQ